MGAINGKIYDFESIKILLPSGQITTAKDINYSAKKDVDVITNSQGIPIGVSRKKFEGDFSMTMGMAEFEALSDSVSGTGGVLGCPSFPVVVSYGNAEEEVVTDTLTVKITEVPREAKEDEEIVMKITGKQVSVPLFNGKPVYDPKY